MGVPHGRWERALWMREMSLTQVGRAVSFQRRAPKGRLPKDSVWALQGQVTNLLAPGHCPKGRSRLSHRISLIHKEHYSKWLHAFCLSSAYCPIVHWHRRRYLLLLYNCLLMSSQAKAEVNFLCLASDRERHPT